MTPRSGPRPRHHLAKHPPFRPGRSDPPPGNLRREDDAPLGGGLGAAARRLVPRRRRQQQHVAVALGQHRRRHDDVLVDAEPRTTERGARARLVAQRLEEVAADDPEQIDVAARRRARSSRWPSSPRAAGTGKPHALCPSRRASPRSTRGTQPTSAPPWTPEWPRIGTRPRFGRPSRPRARPTLTSALTVSTPCACCVRPIDQTKTAFGPGDQQVGELARCARAAMPLSRTMRSQPTAAACAQRVVESGRVLAHEGVVDAAALDERQQHAEQERQIAAGVDVEPVVGQRGAAQRALGDRRNPVALEPRLAIRVHDGDLRRRSSWRGAGTSS